MPEPAPRQTDVQLNFTVNDQPLFRVDMDYFSSGEVYRASWTSRSALQSDLNAAMSAVRHANTLTTKQSGTLSDAGEIPARSFNPGCKDINLWKPFYEFAPAETNITYKILTSLDTKPPATITIPAAFLELGDSPSMAESDGCGAVPRHMGKWLGQLPGDLAATGMEASRTAATAQNEADALAEVFTWSSYSSVAPSLAEAGLSSSNDAVGLVDWATFRFINSEWFFGSPVSRNQLLAHTCKSTEIMKWFRANAGIAAAKLKSLTDFKFLPELKPVLLDATTTPTVSLTDYARTTADFFTAVP
ncbi:hypothetical protein H9P43_002073 [Blastocladiella emersonii ATCC 22665]|nr:hypothetical protein H9P43_002073 [Blastocladiella emersonii ATCC 22665]